MSSHNTVLSFPAKFEYIHKAYVNLYGLFILDVNIKYVVLSRRINVPIEFKELINECMLKEGAPSTLPCSNKSA